ncbi:MAG: histidinol-phosphatase HisJ family protein [Clostridiales bacterium]|nr:histidinol-phosphatase HisJ family protein [Clostridiales bacterium]
MGILYDYHLHSAFSGDSDTPTEEMVQRALTLGLTGICLTEHLDIDAPPDPKGADFTFLDFDAYFAKLEELRTLCGSKIQIGFGMEFGMLPHLPGELSSLNKKYPFDFLILSQHFVCGVDPYYPEYFESRTEREGYEEYFRTEYENLHKFSLNDYDTLGHMDYIIRYGPNRNQNYSYRAYADFIDPILRYLIEHGKCLELNTAGYKYGLNEPNPCADVFRRYRDLGGELVTIGSDAHQPQHIAYDFERAEKLLTSLGFRYYTIFEQRKGRQVRF